VLASRFYENQITVLVRGAGVARALRRPLSTALAQGTAFAYQGQLQSGGGNTANGSDALYYNTSGSYNTAIGEAALQNTTNGSYNIALGYLAGLSFASDESYNIDIGNEGVQGENNTIRIGTPGVQTNTFIAGLVGLGEVTATPTAQLQVVDSGTGTGGNFTGLVNGVIGNATTTGPGGNGVVGSTGTSSGSGVFGYATNPNGGAGVYGASASANGSGVVGFSSVGSGGTFTGWNNGVVASATSTTGGIGVYGATASANGSGVFAQGASSSSPALSIGQGTLQVVGAGQGTSTAAFIQVTTAANTSFNETAINNPQCNGDPNAILFITYNASLSLAYAMQHPIGVGWFNGQWNILFTDATSMPVGIAFNVLVIKN